MKKMQFFGAGAANSTPAAYASPRLELLEVATETGFATSPGGEFTEIDDGHEY